MNIYILATSILISSLSFGFEPPPGEEESPPVPEAVCGDSVLDPAEQCDDGNTISGDGCSDLCVVESSAGICGDGSIHQGELCDDGNAFDGDGCNSSCQIEYCGNGIVDLGEVCEGDTGSHYCSDQCTTLVEKDICGNNVVEAGEECDSANPSCQSCLYVPSALGLIEPSPSNPLG